MPVTRNQLRREKIIGHEIDFGDGDVVKFWFDRNKITDPWLESWDTYEKERNAPALNDMLADLIDRWDVLEHEDGPVVPVSAETIGEIFSIPSKIKIAGELMTASTPSDAEGNASRNTSSSASMDSNSEQEARHNGQSGSTLPQHSVSPSGM